MLLFPMTSKTTTVNGYQLYAHSKQTKPTPIKPNAKDTKRQQTAQRAENVVEHTVPDKNRSGALNAMRSTQRETRDTREVERATRDETETLRTRSRASNARRNGNGTYGKASGKRATKRDGLKGRAGNEVGNNYVSRP